MKRWVSWQKTATVSSRTLQKSKLASDKDIIVKTDRPQTSTLRGERTPQRKLTCPQTLACQRVRLEMETVAAQAAST